MSTFDVDNEGCGCCRCQLSQPVMKLITMATLMFTDLDVSFTGLGLYIFWREGQFALLYIVNVFVLTYMGGAYCANQQRYRFLKRFKAKVKTGIVTEFDEQDMQSIEEDYQFFLACKGRKDKEGKEANCLYIYYTERRDWARLLVTWSHSIPYYRAMRFAWQADIAPTDFAGLLNANGLWSFTAGIAMAACSVYFTYQYKFDEMVAASLLVGIITTMLSLANIILNFPAQLAQREQKRFERMQLEVSAERLIRTERAEFDALKASDRAAILQDPETGIKKDPMGAVGRLAEKTKLYDDAKQELMVHTLKELKRDYEFRKTSYERLMRKA